MGTKHAKQLLIWLHVVSSVGWCAMTVVQLTLLGRGLAMDAHDRLVTFETALYLENAILDPLGVTTAYTGLMLSALTPWSYFRHRWVAAKFWLTWVAVLLGSVVLGKALERIVEAGGAASVTPLAVGTAWNTATLALMVWISIAKPWGRRAVARRADWNPKAWVFLLAVAVPVLEYGIGLDYPLLTLTAVIAAAIRRRIASAQPRRVAAAPALDR